MMYHKKISMSYFTLGTKEGLFFKKKKKFLGEVCLLESMWAVEPESIGLTPVPPFGGRVLSLPHL